MSATGGAGSGGSTGGSTGGDAAKAKADKDKAASDKAAADKAAADKACSDRGVLGPIIGMKVFKSCKTYLLTPFLVPRQSCVGVPPSRSGR